MIDSRNSKEDHPQDYMANIVSAFSKGIAKILSSIIHPWVIIVFIVCVTLLLALFLYRIPPQDLIRLQLGEIIRGLQEVMHATLVHLLGWIVSLVVMFISTVVIGTQHRRIRQQGDELIIFRNREDVARLSAGDEKALTEYPAAAKAKHDTKETQREPGDLNEPDH